MGRGRDSCQLAVDSYCLLQLESGIAHFTALFALSIFCLVATVLLWTHYV